MAKKTTANLDHIVADIRGLARPLSDFTPDPANARKHPERNLEAIRGSLARFGQRKPIVTRPVNGTLVVVAGNGTLEAAKALGWTHLAASVQEMTDAEATAYAIADNRTAELAEWDEGVLAGLLGSLDEELQGITGFNEAEFNDLIKSIGDELIGSEAGSEAELSDRYTKKIIAPVYEPHGPCPPVVDLYDEKKASELIAEIESAQLPPEVNAFLVAAANRHTVFNFRAIAEFYAHASPELQLLMERSALVVIDFDDAIAGGFVRMSQALGELADVEGEGSDDAQ